MEQVDSTRLVAALALLVLGVGAFWDGFYAPAQQLIPVALAAVVALLCRGATAWARHEIAAALLLIAGVALSLRQPAASGVAAHGPVVVAGWLLAMIAGRWVAGLRSGPVEAGSGGRAVAAVERLLAIFWSMMATPMLFAGLVTISSTPVHHSGRLPSPLGYPIALGMLGLLGLTGALPPLAATQRWALFVAAASGTALLLSGSRWVWVVALLVALYLLVRVPFLLRLAAGRAAVALALALVAALWAAPAVAARQPGPLLLVALLLLLTGLGAGWFPGNWFRWWILLPVGGAWLAGLLTAPGWPWLLGRATALPLTEGSSVERLTFLQDGLAIVLLTPLGAGLRGWTALHLQGASYSYYAAEVHSAALDLAIAFGWLGGIGFLWLLLRFLSALLTAPGQHLVLLAGLGGLALHSGLDWLLSYGLFAFPLWFGFGLAGPPRSPVMLPDRVTRALAALTLAGVALLGAGDLATALAERALGAGDPRAALRHSTAAVAITPWNDAAHARLGQAAASLGDAQRALRSLERARALGPREPWYATLHAQALAGEGRLTDAAAAWAQSAALWPWHLPAYERALEGHIELIARARIAGDEEGAALIARSGLAVLAQLADQAAREPAGRPRRPLPTDSPTIRRADALFRATLGSP